MLLAANGCYMLFKAICSLHKQKNGSYSVKGDAIKRNYINKIILNIRWASRASCIYSVLERLHYFQQLVSLPLLFFCLQLIYLSFIITKKLHKWMIRAAFSKEYHFN